MVQSEAMVWNRKQTAKRAFAKAKALVLSPAENAERRAAAAWPTGMAHLWLKRAPNAIMLPAERLPKRVQPRGNQ